MYYEPLFRTLIPQVQKRTIVPIYKISNLKIFLSRGISPIYYL